MIQTNVEIGKVSFKNPLTVCSGTFGVGKEFGEFVNLNRLGAITSKGVSLNEWNGNNTPRAVETYAGMLNSIGLQNPGVESFIKNDLPFLTSNYTKHIVNVVGKTIEEYEGVVERLSSEEITGFEINISCPNVKEGGMAFGTNPEVAAQVTKAVKRHSRDKLVIVKLSPNVTDITLIAKAVQDAGADAISLINTLGGMKIDIRSQKPILANKFGGLSGPCIKPIAVKMIYQCYEAVKIPIIGMGGVSTWKDMVELMLAGATMVAVGTANFNNPCVTMEILDDFEKYLEENFISAKDLIGKAH